MQPARWAKLRITMRSALFATLLIAPTVGAASSLLSSEQAQVPVNDHTTNLMAQSDGNDEPPSAGPGGELQGPGGGRNDNKTKAIQECATFLTKGAKHLGPDVIVSMLSLVIAGPEAVTQKAPPPNVERRSVDEIVIEDYEKRPTGSEGPGSGEGGGDSVVPPPDAINETSESIEDQITDPNITEFPQTGQSHPPSERMRQQQKNQLRKMFEAFTEICRKAYDTRSQRKPVDQDDLNSDASRIVYERIEDVLGESDEIEFEESPDWDWVDALETIAEGAAGLGQFIWQLVPKPGPQY